MRNLKRVLSLALACVMVLGLMVVGAGAADTYADLTDSTEINNKEAVSLLVDLGIVSGTNEGDFKPDVVVDRATMAKLITVMMMGNVDQDSFRGTVTDLTDIDSSWAEGYIKFCYSNKIIAGDGLGHFYPTEPVTVVQAAKMLLVASGYVSKDRGYEGDNWSVNVMRDSNSAKEDDGSIRAITSGLSVRANDPLTRENAAQMIFNALFIQTKVPTYSYDMGQQYVSGYSYNASLAASMYDGLKRKTAVLDSVAGGSLTLDPADAKAAKLSAEPNDVGNFVAYYVDRNGNPVSSAVVSTSVEPIASCVKGTAFASLTDKTASAYIGYQPDDAVSVYANGTKLGKYTSLADLKTGVGTGYDKVGVEIDFIDTDSNGRYNTVKITVYTFTVVNKITAAKGDTEATITLNGFTKANESEVVGGLSGLSEGDYVMAAKIGDLWYICETTSKTGSVTRYNDSKKQLTIDGTNYTWSELDNKSTLTSPVAFHDNTQSTFYFDKNNHVVGVAPIAVEKKYAVVDSIAYVPTAGITGSGYAEARLVFADASTAVVNVAKIDGKTPVSGTPSGTQIKVDTDKTKNGTFENAIYTYTVNSSGDYVLTTVQAALAGTVTKGVATIPSVVTCNNNTVYVYKVSNKWYTYKGYRNAPSTEAGVAVSYVASGGYATLVYVNGGLTTTTVLDLIVFVGSNGVDNSGSSPVYEYTAYVNGEETTVYSETELKYEKKTLYQVIRDEDDFVCTTTKGSDFTATPIATVEAWDYATAKSDAKNGAVKTDVVRAAEGSLSALTDATLTYNGSETVYVIRQDGTVEKGTAEDIATGTNFWVQTVDLTTAAGRVAIKLAYVVEPAS